MSQTSKPFAEACERNRAPILAVLERVLSGAKSVLEIGSGTGQHAVYFAQHLPHLSWQPSDLPEDLPGIRAWIAEASGQPPLPPLARDVARGPWPQARYDAVFSANTAHIMSWPQVERMVAGAAAMLQRNGRLCLYGPFNYGGHYTSASNAAFDASLRARAPHMGIRDFAAMDALAQSHGFALLEDAAMPANNRLLVWERPGEQTKA